MVHRLNTNKQFMIGNGILAFGVIAVVVIFTYMSLRGQQQHAGERNYQEHYTLTFAEGFAGDSATIYLNDSLLLCQPIGPEPITLSVQRFAEYTALIYVDNATERIAVFELNENGGDYCLTRRDGEVSIAEAPKP